MRNLKKFLALVLAMLMVVSASAVVSADFTDVAADSQYAEAINDLAVKGITAGTTATTFGPDEGVTRLQMALFVARACTGEVEDNTVWANGVVPFTDVTEFKGAVQYAFLNGIIAGRDDVTFDPKGGIAYQDALTMAVRALGYDLPASEYPLGFYKKAAALGLTDGINTVSELTETLNRAETAQIIFNMIYADRADSDVHFAAENFELDVARTSDLFVITATPKQSYATGYVAETNKTGETFVGIQPLVNGVPDGEMIYLTAQELGIEVADVEKYINYTVELVDYDAETGDFYVANLGEAPDVYYNDDVTLNTTTGKLTVDGVVYNVADNISGSKLVNEIVTFAGSNKVATQAKYLLEDDDGYVYEGTENGIGAVPVAKRVSFGGSNTKYYAVLTGEGAGTIISESAALEAWGFTTTDVQYTKYSTLTAAQIDAYGAYELQLFDDNLDGKYDRAIANAVYMSVYTTSGSGSNTVVNNVATADNNVKLNQISFTDTSVQSKGKVYVYTYNEQLKQVNVIDVVTPAKGTLTQVDASKILKTNTEENVVYTIDGKKYIAAHVSNTPEEGVSSITVDRTVTPATLGANFIASGTVNKFADIANGNLAYSNAFDLISIYKVRIAVNYYAYNGVVLYIEPVAASTPDSYITVMSELINIDDDFENLIVEMYVDGELDEQLVAKIDGKEIAKLSDRYFIQLGNLLGKAELFYPGLVYRTNINADGEYTLIETLDPTDEDSIEDFGLTDITASSATSVTSTIEGVEKQIAFDSGISTTTSLNNKIFTDDDTVFYFIDRSLNSENEIVEGNLTKVRTYVGMPDDAAILIGENTIVLADNVGINAGDFANVVIVYEAAGANGFGYVQETSSVVYVPNKVLQVTKAGTAEELGLGEQYKEDNYYYYAGAAIDLETGKKVDIITTEILSDTIVANNNGQVEMYSNVNAIYEIDSNGVVVETTDIYGNPVYGAYSYFMTLEEAADAGILVEVENAVVSYHTISKTAVIHDKDEVNTYINFVDKVTSLTVFPIAGDIATSGNFVTNADVNKENKMPDGIDNDGTDVIDGGEIVYYLADSIADGSVTVLYGPMPAAEGEGV